MRYSDIYDYKDEIIENASYMIQFVKSLGSSNVSEYDIYKLLYTEYVLDIKDAYGNVKQVTVNGGWDDILDHFDAYLQDKKLNKF